MQLLTEKLSESLKSSNDFLYTILNHHRTHENKPIRFRNYKYLKDIYKDKAHHKVFKKGTQSKISEYLLALAINYAMKDKNVLYGLPTDTLRTRYVTSRVNKTIEYTQYYKDHQKKLDSTSLKGFNNGIINFVGSGSENNFAEFVAQVIIIDEKNLCNLDNVVMATERQAAQEMEDRYLLEAANPTICDYGIDVDYERSDQKKWYIECSCGHSFEIDFFKHVVRQEGDHEYVIIDQDFDWTENRDCYILCDKCGKPVDRFGAGHWEAESKSIVSGYQFNQFFTSPTPVRDQLQKFQDGLTDERVLQRFYNASLGRSYTSAGARITRDMLNIGDYSQMQTCTKPCIIGVDVGSLLHYVIGYIDFDRSVKIIRIGTANDEKEIFELCRLYNIVVGIIDAAPEIRLSRRICATIKGFWSCIYLTESVKDSYDMNAKIIKVDRTSSMDLLKEAIILKQLTFPRDTPGEFMDHMEASTRIWVDSENMENKGFYKWVHSKPDHWHHGLNYMNLCKRLLTLT